MGWTVLYVAFGIVALWLLGEVLLQYKARLRWRLLAFAGFTGVVIGVVALSSVVVIALGAICFAVGQTFVTLSYRRGFSTGWALNGVPGLSRRRPDDDEYADEEYAEADPVLEVSGVEPAGPGEGPAGYASPFPDDTGGYGAYDRAAPQPTAAPAPPGYAPEQPHYAADQQGYAPQGGYAGYGYDEQHQYAAPSHDPYAAGYDTGQFPTQAGQPPAAGPEYAGTPAYGYGGYDTGTTGYPTVDPTPYGAHDYPTQGYGVQDYDTQGYDTQGYGQGYPAPDYPAQNYPAQGYPAQDYAGQDYATQGFVPQQQPYPSDTGAGQSYDPYAAQQEQGYWAQTPTGQVWVPAQREAEQVPEQTYPYPYQEGTGPGGQPGGYGYDTSGQGYYYG